MKDGSLSYGYYVILSAAKNPAATLRIVTEVAA
jgi:hypothetical protein